MATFVEEAGYAPLFAGNADEALKLVESRDDIRVLLTDIDMPGAINGVRLAQIVSNRRPSIGIMVVSGQGMPHDAHLPKRSRFFSKPYAPDQMVGALRALTLG